MRPRIYTLLSLLVLTSVIMAGCAPAATATTAPPAATQPPSATSEPGATAGPTACAPAQPGWDPTTADKGTKGITIAYEQEPDQAVGNFSNMSFSGWLYQMFGVGAGRWDDKNNLVAYAATQIPSSDNGGVAADGTVTWKLKPCIFWSDGQPITSKDIAFTWKAVMDPGNAPISRSDWAHVASIDTPDDQTAVIHFKGLDPAWPLLLDLGPNNSSGSILPSHIFEGKTGLEKDPQVHQPTWAGGPFAIKEWIPGDHLTLVRNPNFFGTPSKLDYIDIKFVPDPETGLAALKTGDVDLMVNLAESDIETVNAMEPNGIHLRVDPTPEFEHLIFNLGVTNSTVKDASGKVVGNSDVAGFCPFQDVNVRKAIMLGTDRLSFIKNYLKEDEKAFIATLWPNSYWNNTSLQPYPYDPDQANQLLDAAGYPKGSDGIRAGTCDGKPVKFSLGLETTTAQRRIDNMAALQADLKKIGIDIKPNPIPAGTFFGTYQEGADMTTGKFDMAIFTTGYYPDPDATGNWDCPDVPSKDNPLGANDYHLCDPKLDAMWAQGLATADPAGRKKVYDEIQQYMYDNVLMVPLYARANVFAYNDRFVFPPSSGYSNFGWDAENFDVKQ
ncbi:MAG TPA: peptide ABC transporter substrate-binding protein [Anaerolineales bacterium]|nr:peptide ABC transporter substrate-binding protein [Anaerolineales bacterium]